QEAVMSPIYAAIATVTSDGTVTGVSPGDAVIEAYIGDITASCTVTVSEKETVIEVTSIRLSDTSLTLYIGAGSTVKLKATARPSDATNTSLTFASSDAVVVTVSSNGTLTPKKAGSAKITVTASNGVSAECSVTVKKASQTASPTILDYSFLDSNNFAIIGTCEDNATVVATNGTDVCETTADKKYFSVSLPKTGSSTQITITATAENKTQSEQMTYTVNYKTPAPDKGLWAMLWGKNYQFFISHTGNTDLGLKDILRTNSLTSSQISTFKSKVDTKVAALKKINKNAELIYIIIPAPASVYPELLPDSITPTNNPSRLEQIYEALEDTNAKYINVLELFEEHKYDNLKLYWKTDTHWTDYGGFLVYEELFDIIDDNFPDAYARPMSDFTFTEGYYYGGDLAYYINIDRTLMQEWNALRVPNFDMPSMISSIQRYVSAKQLTYRDGIIDQKQYVYTNRSHLPTTVIYRDSYSTQMFDIIAERCDTSAFHAMWDYTLNTSEFKSLDADYVIYIINERNIGSILN
ncbi:MAG TPA: Ig-like domain-containing protein, partial [Bacillota bacterium]|nr:Ig-like domain-containing protein [Bacillota bacterium]